MALQSKGEKIENIKITESILKVEKKNTMDF